MATKSNKHGSPSEQPRRAGKTISSVNNGKLEKNSPMAKKTEALTFKKEPDDSNYYEENDIQQQHSRNVAHSEFDGDIKSRVNHLNRKTFGLKRVRSHARSIRSMSNPSAVWVHFDLCSNDQLRAECRLCGAVVVRGGSNPRQCGTTNLHRHLRVHHGGQLIGDKYRVKEDDQECRDDEVPARKIVSNNSSRPMRKVSPGLPSSNSPAKVQKVIQEQNHRSQAQENTSNIRNNLLLNSIQMETLKQVNSLKSLPQPNLERQRTSQHQPETESNDIKICLKWNCFATNMQATFSSLLQEKYFVDVTLASEGKSIKCHKLILASCSDYLGQLLKDNSCRHPIIIMRDLKFWQIEALVAFMYQGEVTIPFSRLMQLLSAAETLQIKGLSGSEYLNNSEQSQPPQCTTKPQASSTPSSYRQSTTIPRPKVKSPKRITRTIATKSTTLNKSSLTNRSESAGIPQACLGKRGTKRQAINALVNDPEMYSFTKICMKRPVTPSTPAAQPHNSESNTGTSSKTGPNVSDNCFNNIAVKEEPIDYPLSPGDHQYQMGSREEDNSTNNKDDTAYESFMMRIQRERNTNGGGIELADPGSDYDNDDYLDNTDDDIDDDENEDDEDIEHMEFVPSDFLEQEQNIVENSENQTNRSSLSYDGNDNADDREHNEDEEDEEEQGDKEEAEEVASRDVTNKKISIKKVEASKIERVRDKDKS